VVEGGLQEAHPRLSLQADQVLMLILSLRFRLFSLHSLPTLASDLDSHTIHAMVHQTLTGSISLLALLQPALSMSLSPFAKADSMPARTECQQNVDDHGELYMSPSTLSEYALSCNSDHYGGDLDHVGSDSFLGCIGVCDANPDCIGYAYTPGNCYLKHTYTRKEVSSHVDFALNIQRNLTARPYEAPAKPAPASGSCEYYNEHNWALQGGSRDIKLTGTAMGTNHAPNSHDRALHPQYQFSCGTDHPGGDIGAVGAKTFDSCVDICDTTVDCVGFAWLGGNGPGECYLKGRITDGEANSNVDFASKRSATKKIEVETSISVVPSTSVVASTSVVVSTSVSIVPETPKETSTPLATATETRTIWTLTGSSSIPVATVTSTRIILTPTGLLTVPVKTLLDSAGVPIKSLPAFSPILVKTPSGSASVPVKSLPAFSPILIKTPSGSASVSIKSMSIFSPVPWIAPTGLSSVAGNTSNSIAASPSLTNQLESLKNPLLTVAPFSPHWSTSTKSASGSGDIVESLNTMKIPTSTYISAPAATHVLPSLDSVPSEPSDIPMVPETPSYPRSCSELRASGDRKLRTRVTRGNMDYDGLFLTQWDPNLGKEKCRENSCSKFETCIFPPIFI